ncbi:MAG: hypothetical protein Q4A27_01515 [bacterium]|nr:hypothetical protein [bacterium]
MKKKLIINLLDLFAPNSCYFCGKLGDLICENCFEKQDFEIRMVSKNGKNQPDREFYISERSGILKRMVDDLKFKNKKENALFLAQILAQALAKNPIFLQAQKEIILLPVPTSSRHIRQRGFDHTELISKNLAKILEIRKQKTIIRKADFVQRGASKTVRFEQAAQSYDLAAKIEKQAIYCVLDDIRTTGATLNSISQTLKRNGAREVWAIYLMQQKQQK